MEMKKGLICGRDENPETCFLCEQEGKDYCMICADACTLEDLHSITKNVRHDHYQSILLKPKQFLKDNRR